MSDWKNVQYKDGKMRTSEGGGGGGSSTFAGLDDVSFDNIQNGQVPKYNSETHKWENADESGGGGTVTDVEVDGVSVVNQQGVAEIEMPNVPVQDVQVDGTSVVNAQGVAEITMPTPLIYSDEEREVGVWRNGKPLYERTYICSVSDLVNSTVNSSQISGEYHFVNTDTSKWDMYRLIEGQLFNFGNTVNTVKSNWLNYPSSNAYIRCNLQQVNNQGDIFAYINLTYSASNFYNDRSNIKFCFVIQYTKTTDVAGSGQWTTSGTPTHHYSTTERVIGTWIDGKPLYEKTYDFGSSGLTISYTAWTVSNITKAGFGVIVYARATNQTGGAYFGDVMVSRETDNTYLSFQTARNGNNETIRYVTIQYTKTSD